MKQSDSFLRKLKLRSSYCFGRDTLAAQVVLSAQEAQSVLLFGGRQSGKTTLLKYISSRLEAALQSEDGFATIMGVYVDLMALPYDADPPSFFRHVAKLTSNRCAHLLPGYKSPQLPSTVRQGSADLDLFLSDLSAILDATEGKIDRFIFLLDESKRILGSRFPRGFHDNLFALLYGGNRDVGDRVAIVFAGAQDLNVLCQEDTSPIGSRAMVHLVTNLEPSAISKLTQNVLDPTSLDDTEKIVDFIYRTTGGHAGCSARLVEDIAEFIQKGPLDFATLSAITFRKSILLFRIWNTRLTQEARTVMRVLAKHDGLSLAQTAAGLTRYGFDRLKSDQVWDELQYIGIASVKQNRLHRANTVYWKYFSQLEEADDGTEDEREAWALIEELEVTLRSFIQSQYETKWPETAFRQMEQVLGKDAWAQLEQTMQRSNNYYPYSPDKGRRNIMECMYLVQLGNLMITNQAWHLFKTMFRDKRQLQDMLASISPVRNDRAHFVKVPPKELERCKIACDDLLFIVEEGLTKKDILSPQSAL